MTLTPQRRVVDGYTFTQGAEADLIELFREDVNKVKRILENPDEINDHDKSGRGLWQYRRDGEFVWVHPEDKVIISLGGGEFISLEERAERRANYVARLQKTFDEQKEVRKDKDFMPLIHRAPLVRDVPASKVVVKKLPTSKPVEIPKPTPLTPPQAGINNLQVPDGPEDPRWISYWKGWMGSRVSKNPNV